MEIYCMMQGAQIQWQPEGWAGMGDGREVQEGGDICIPMADSCWYVAESNTIS